VNVRIIIGQITDPAAAGSAAHATDGHAELCCWSRENEDNEDIPCGAVEVDLAKDVVGKVQRSFFGGRHQTQLKGALFAGLRTSLIIIIIIIIVHY